MKQTYSYDDKKDIKNFKCKICKTEIEDEEFEFEDYFVVFRGHSEHCFEGFICFSCLKENGGVVGS